MVTDAQADKEQERAEAMMEQYPGKIEEIGTVRALRLALVQIDNQQMTVAELRHKLFEQHDQSATLTIGELRIIAQ